MKLYRSIKSWLGGSDSAQSGLVLDFGEPESVTSEVEYLSTCLFTRNEAPEYYIPPISKLGLAKMRFANGYHSRMPIFRRDKVINLFEKSPILERRELGLMIENLLVTADCYIGIIFNGLNQPIKLYALPSVYMRIKPKEAKGGYRYCQVNQLGEIVHQFYDHEVIHISQDDLRTNLYGVPEYYGSIQSVLLNEAATLFRRKYYINGAHLGSLFISTSQALKPKDEEAISKKIRQSKGVGNWRSMFLHMPGHAQKASDVFNVVPVGDVATKDEFKAIKEITGREICAAWGTREEVAGISPEAIGGTGDLEKLHALDYENKSLPIINRFLDAINAHLQPSRKIKFKEPKSLSMIMISE